MTALDTRDPDHQECQKDPIFLLQRREYRLCSPPSWLAYDDAGYWIEFQNGPVPDDALAFLKRGELDEVGLLKWLAEGPYSEDGDELHCLELFHVVGVWYSRAEAEAFAKETEYRYDHGWRVFCASAFGTLADILDKSTVESLKP